MAAYVLTQRPVIDALEAAVRRGVKLRLYLDPDQRDPQDGEPRERLAALLRMPGVETRFKAASRGTYGHYRKWIMHKAILNWHLRLFRFSLFPGALLLYYGWAIRHHTHRSCRCQLFWKRIFCIV
jgi:hypothetical protein